MVTVGPGPGPGAGPARLSRVRPGPSRRAACPGPTVARVKPRACQCASTDYTRLRPRGPAETELERWIRVIMMNFAGPLCQWQADGTVTAGVPDYANLKAIRVSPSQARPGAGSEPRSVTVTRAVGGY